MIKPEGMNSLNYCSALPLWDVETRRFAGWSFITRTRLLCDVVSALSLFCARRHPWSWRWTHGVKVSEETIP